MGLPLGVIGIVYLLLASKFILVRDSNPGTRASLLLLASNEGDLSDTGYWVALEVVTIKGKSPIQLGLHNVSMTKFKAIIKTNTRQVI